MAETKERVAALVTAATAAGMVDVSLVIKAIHKGDIDCTMRVRVYAYVRVRAHAQASKQNEMVSCLG